MPIFSILCKLDKLDRNAAARLFFSFEVYLNAVLFNLLLFFPSMFFFGFLYFSRVFFYRLKQLFRSLCQFCDRLAGAEWRDLSHFKKIDLYSGEHFSSCQKFLLKSSFKRSNFTTLSRVYIEIQIQL